MYVDALLLVLVGTEIFFFSMHVHVINMYHGVIICFLCD